jgi:hypothetical protein
MSNTSVVTPYEESESTSRSVVEAEDLAGGGIAEAIGEIAAFFADRDADRASDRVSAAVRGQQTADDFRRRRQTQKVPLVSVNLHLADAGSLLRSAPEAGFRLTSRLARPKADLLVLENPRGERLVIEQARVGGVRMHAVGTRAPINDLMRQHTLDRALEHLRNSGREVMSQTLASGEVQILARGGSEASTGELHAQIRQDGSSVLDVVGAQGPKGMELVRGFAEATGGVITETVKKAEYFTRPGELRRNKVRA